MNLQFPSSKWWAATAVSTLTLAAAMIQASRDQGVELPHWIILIGAVVGPIVTYLKPENNPSESAKRTIEVGPR